MPWLPVTSRAFAAARYDRDSRHLEIQYHDGRIYRHYRVPERVYIKLVGATSPGTYLNEGIKPFFESIELPPELQRNPKAGEGT